jgi:hypothetical protein
MKKRINVTGDIESRRRIAERRIPQHVEPVKSTHDGREKDEAEETPHQESKDNRSRKRKTEGDA